MPRTPLNIQINGCPISAILALNVADALIELQVIEHDRIRLNQVIDYEAATKNRHSVIAPLQQWALHSPHLCPHCETTPALKDDSKKPEGKYYVGCANENDCPVWPIGQSASSIPAAIRLWNQKFYI